MKIIRNIAVCIIVLIMHNAISFAQVNHVSNPSFEDLISCPSGGGQIDSAISWGTLVNGGGSTPDLFAECCTQPYNCGVPMNLSNHSFQYPHSGKNYIGVIAAGTAYPNIFREYIQSKFNKKLSSGHSYCVKFYASLSDQSNAYLKTIGAYLDNGNISALQPYGLAVVTPQLCNTNQLLNNTLNWMKIEGSFVSTGNEEYITIGNFFNDSNSDIVITGSPTNWFSYYYIDDVSVIDANLPAYAGRDTLIYSSDSVFIGRHPEIGLDEDCIWFVNGIPIDTMAGIWVKPDSTTTYILQQTICGNVSYDTVKVIVSGVGVEDYANLNNGLKVFPNPNNGQFSITLKGNNLSNEYAEVTIYDVLGNQVGLMNLKLHDNTTIFYAELSNGIYFISVKDSKGNIYNPKKIIVIK